MSTLQSNHPYVISVNIADFTLALTTSDGAVAARLRQRYHDFLDDSQEAIATVALKIVPNASFIEIKPGPWIIESTYSTEKLTYCSYIERGAIDWETRTGYLEMHPDAHVENFLRVVYAWLALRSGGVLLHAAGLVRDGDGYVFFGPSGAGKSTTTALSAPFSDVLSDDLVILRCDENGCTLYGVPFRGDFSDAPRANQRAPLKGIFRLHQDTEHYLEPLPRAIAIAELVASSPFIVRDLSLSQQLLTVCQQVVDKVPVKLMHFRRDDGFWRVIDGHFANLPETSSPDGRPAL